MTLTRKTLCQLMRLQSRDRILNCRSMGER